MEITKKCQYCGNDYITRSNNTKYCPECRIQVGRNKALQHYYEHREQRREYVAQYNKEYFAGERRGYNQSGENNNHWRGGAQCGYYGKFMKDACERCGSKHFLVVHHRDRNRSNNAPENLETLCKRCHQIEHKCWENFTKGIVRSSENKESEE